MENEKACQRKAGKVHGIKDQSIGRKARKENRTELTTGSYLEFDDLADENDQFATITR